MTTIVNLLIESKFIIHPVYKMMSFAKRKKISGYKKNKFTEWAQKASFFAPFYGFIRTQKTHAI